ncbi:MAG: UvrD-helicase domain-containing protein [Solobacterium sp.]|nr:UvrD-helicase domain-containing protein [Solobacterium sp.]
MDMFEDVLEGLNEEQLQAVTETEGYVRVIAGAGSGKTRALTRRFAYLVNELGIRPGNILCVTFTNKAANEMRQRIHQLTGDNDTGYINTFHGFCVSVLQEDSHAVSYPKSFLVLDNSDIDAMLRIIYEERGLTLRDMTFANARDYFEMRKGLYEPDYYLHMIQMSLEDLHQKYLEATEVNDILFYGYLYQEKKCFGLDYNDLIFFTLYIFKQNEEIKLKWQKRLEYIMIDEFQDIDPPQYQLMEQLCGFHGNLFVVGDPDQTIYTWRGANVRFLMDFDQRFIGTETIMMMKNYRSTPEIISCANSLIEKNRRRIKKELIPLCEHGQASRYHHAPSAAKEAEWIAQEVKNLHEKGVDYKDITILYRAHYVTRSIEDAFLKEELPYAIYSGVQFFARAEIKDALSYLRMIALKDDLSFLRIVNLPKRNMGDRRIAWLQAKADEEHISLYEALKLGINDPVFANTKAVQFIDLIEKFSRETGEKPVSVLLGEILDESGYELMLRTEGSQTRLDNLAELKQSIHEYEVSCGEETDLVSYLNHIALFTNQDVSERRDQIRMMTIHAAKGLEFPYVFLAGMNEGILPSRKTNTEMQMEEERRLAFVAVTRAEKGLYLSDAEGQNFDRSSRYVSRFVLDIDKKYLEYDNELKADLLKESQDYIARSEKNVLPDAEDLPFKEGDRVSHRVFGEGTVERIDYQEEAVFVKFDRMPTSRGISLRAAGKLAKI